MIHDKNRRDVILIEVGISRQDRTKITPYVMIWDGIVTNFHKRYAKDISISDHIKPYIQWIYGLMWSDILISKVLKKILESISFDDHYGFHEDGEKRSAQKF
ncbi:unnamed protein product [Thelazia callipaeda]|uniref:Reverse transcriptase n=1 Tax=Thelazia callipaeda TaxID=103827 RepID=A0A0N5D2E1_THECL|nr:unnamed protein product [Thelazia callipaeda]